MEVQSAKRKEKKEGMEFIHVIMPVRLQEGE
jgi:hypothetical protein